MVGKTTKPKVAKESRDELYKAQDAEIEKKAAIKKYSGKKTK